MPTLETPPNPNPVPTNTTDSGEPQDPSGERPVVKVRTRRFGELEEHELIYLLDSLDDERAKSRFRESIYISVFIWMVIAWLVVYGPRYLFHQPEFVTPVAKSEHQMTSLNLPADVARALAREPKRAPAPAVKQPTPAPPVKALPQPKLQPQPKPQVAPLPPTPQPQAKTQTQAPPPPPTPRVQAEPTPLPSAPTPSRQTSSSSVPNQNASAGDLINQAARASRSGGGLTSGNPNGPSGHHGLGTGVDILSDTMGVDFNPYLQRIMREIYETWLPLIPEEARPPLNKQGETQIRFIILPDGRIGGMVLEGSTHDDAINRSCWGSITGVGQFPALPSQFHGPNLELRVHYLVNIQPK